MSRLVPLVLVGFVVGYGFSHPAHGCATAYREGATVRVAEESAIIYWDSGSNVEHFIRRATFTSGTPDFGFLVPTPTQPTLSESSDAVFASLEKAIAPEVVHRYVIEPQIGC